MQAALSTRCSATSLYESATLVCNPTARSHVAKQQCWLLLQSNSAGSAGNFVCRQCTTALALQCHLRRYKFEDRQVVDYVREATRKNIWYYRDRMSVPRGPCSLPVLRECWVRAAP